MNYYEEHAKKSDAELCADGSGIEPEYTRAHALAEQVMAQFEAEQFQPLLKKITDHVTEHLWNVFRDHLIDDTGRNVAGYFRDRIDRTVKALLGGDEWAVKLYVTGSGYDLPQIRKALAAVIPVPLQEARVKDLEAEIVQLKDDLARERDWYSRR